MNIPESIQTALTEYHADWRHPRLEPFKISGIYSLFPDEAPAEHNWPVMWPGAGYAGVYFVFGAQMQLLYIGSGFNVAGRLSQHFSGSRGPCRILEPGWKTRPAFIATIATLRQFEASSLEEFLIEVLDPPENVHGKTRKVDTMQDV
jgi:hypothetical protein